MTTTLGLDLLATGSDDRTVRIWDAATGVTQSPPLPHPAPVTKVAFGDVDGRTMVVSGCLDGNVRLWDPLRSSAARVSVDGWFPAIAVHADVVAVMSEEGQIRIWNLADGATATYSRLSMEPGGPRVFNGALLSIAADFGVSRETVRRARNDLLCALEASSRTSDGGLTIDYDHYGADYDRYRWAQDERKIIINLDHPVVKLAKDLPDDEATYRRLIWEIAFTAYAVALADLQFERDPARDSSDATYEIREALRRVWANAGALYAV